MNKDGFEFDLVTQRFLINRWETEAGKRTLEQIIESIKAGADVRGILDEYVLHHPQNQDPYAHPYYPKDAMNVDAFWVLTQDDLRGIRIYNENFPAHAYFGKKSLNYARFYNCVFNNVNFERTNLTSTVFEKCILQGSCIAVSGGYYTCFIDCDMTNVCFTQSYFQDADFSGSNLKGAYFELAKLNNINVNYRTNFDTELNNRWSTRQMPENEEPEILKSIRLAYEKAEIWQKADQYLFLERNKNRRSLLWPLVTSNRSFSSFIQWLLDWLWCFFTGYGTQPWRIILASFLVAIFFSVVYFVLGNPGEHQEFSSSLYFSFTTFTTLGYGDLHYTADRWVMRLISTAEAFIGASLIAIFVAVLSRKLLRH